MGTFYGFDPTSIPCLMNFGVKRRYESHMRLQRVGPAMTQPLLAILLALGLLTGCATSGEMTNLEPRAQFEAKNSLSEYRDCLFRWASMPGGRLEYHPEGIFVKDIVGSPMYLIAQRDDLISVYVHWNMMFLKDTPIYLAGRCNDDVSSFPPDNLWSTLDTDDLPEFDKYVQQKP